MAGRYLPEIYRPTRENKTLFEAQEQPSDQITVKILVKSVSSVLNDVNTIRRLTEAGMHASRDDKNNKAIVVKGIRPYHGYGAQDILKVVQIFDRGASIIR